MCLVDQVCFVYLVDLVLLVSFVQPNKRDKPNNGLPTLADFPSILLVHESLKKRISLAPFAMPTVGIDMPCLADIDESAPQAIAQCLAWASDPSGSFALATTRLRKANGVIGTGTNPRAVAGKLALCESGTATRNAHFGTTAER